MNRINLLRNQLTGGKVNDEKTRPSLVLVKSINEGQIKIVTMNTSLNALTRALLKDIYETLLELDLDNETKVIILTGNEKAFAAGADIKQFSKTNYGDLLRSDWDLLQIENIYYHINKPIIAAINGITYGGGFELALSCDLIIASEKAIFGFPELKLGLFPGAGGTQRLPKLMGYHKAMEYILTAKDISLQELKLFGVINDICPHEELEKRAIQLAERICKFSILSVIASKKAMKLSLETNLFSGLKAEKFLFQGIFSTQDKAIGIEAFLNKKQSKFIDK